MHWYVGFRDPVPAPTRADPVRVGRRAARADPDDPAALREARARRTRCWRRCSPTCRRTSRSGWPRGSARRSAAPTRYSQRDGGYPRMLSQHVGKELTEEQRARWVALLLPVRRRGRAARTTPSSGRRSPPTSSGARGSRWRTPSPAPGRPEHMPMPHWDWGTAAGPPGSTDLRARPADAADEPRSTLPGRRRAGELRRRTSSRCSANATASR